LGDPALSDHLRRWRCAMRIVLKDGRELDGETLSAKGGFDNPLTREDEEIKAVDLIAPVLGGRAAQALIRTMWHFDDVSDVCELRPLLVPQ